MRSTPSCIAIGKVVLLSTILCIAGCKKDDNSTVGPSGEGTTPTGMEFIRFKLDGTLLDMTVPQAPIFVLYTNLTTYTMAQFGGGALLGNTHYSTLNLVFDSLDVPHFNFNNPN